MTKDKITLRIGKPLLKEMDSKVKKGEMDNGYFPNRSALARFYIEQGLSEGRDPIDSLKSAVGTLKKMGVTEEDATGTVRTVYKISENK